MTIFKKIAMRADLHGVFQELFTKYLPKDAVVYDVGCGQKPFAPFLAGKVRAHIGVDLDSGFYEPDQRDLIGTAYDVPADSGAADVVISSQVLEHLERPVDAINETHRLLKAGGMFFVSFPFLYPQHAQPHDYLRYTEFYLINMIAGERFELLQLERIGGFWYLIGMYINLYLQPFDRGLLRKFFIIKAISFISSVFFRLLHGIEGFAFKAAGKNINAFRAPWTINYVAVLRKKECL